MMATAALAATAGKRGNGGNGGSGGNGLGGGLAVMGGSITLLGDTVSNNKGQGGTAGPGGRGGFGGFGGAGGLGGDIFTASGSPHRAAYGGNGGSANGLARSQLNAGQPGQGGSGANGGNGGTGGNAGSGGSGGNGGAGGSAFGGGVYVRGGSITIVNDTIAQNEVVGGSGGFGGFGGHRGFGGLGGSGGRGGSGGFADGGLGTKAPNGNPGSAGANGTSSASSGSSGGTGTNGSSGGGGVYVAGGAVSVFNSTLADNVVIFGGTGGGINVAAGSVSIVSTIVALNTDETSSADDIAGTVTGSYNLIGTGGSGGLVDGVNHNQVGVADPGLGALTGNGGPTQTIALLSGSLAIGKGSNPENLLTDQRGFVIPPGTTLDVGAYQTKAVTDTAPTVTLQAMTVTSANASALNPYTFSITFTDQGAIAASTLAGAVVMVDPSGGGTPIAATIVSATPVGPTDVFGNARQFVLALEITPPGGAWTGADNGVYSVVLGGIPVLDLAGQSVPTGTVGTFLVDVGTVSIHASGLSFRAQKAGSLKGSYNGTITITNTGTSTLFGSISVEFQGLNPNFVLSSSTAGVTTGTTAGGTEFLTINLATPLAAGQSLVVAVTFGNVTFGQPVSYTPFLLIGVLPT